MKNDSSSAVPCPYVLVMVLLEAVEQDKEITEAPLVLDLAERYLKACGSRESLTRSRG